MNLFAFVPMYAGWMEDITNFIRRQVERVWEALVKFFQDLVIYAIEKMLDLVALAFEQLPVPQFLHDYNLNMLLGNAGSTVGWFVQTFKIGECLAVIALGIIFRITRKILTLGKW
jgi:hypothetical protein